MTRVQMFDAILAERQIEFAFEGKRFWDLRRWNRLGTVLNLNGRRRHGATITLSATAPTAFATTRDGLNLDFVYTTYFTVVTTKLVDTAYDLNWLDSKYNFFAIPQSAIDNNPQIQQNNNGWGGAFDEQILEAVHKIEKTTTAGAVPSTRCSSPGHKQQNVYPTQKLLAAGKELFCCFKPGKLQRRIRPPRLSCQLLVVSCQTLGKNLTDN